MKGELSGWRKSSRSGAQADCVEVGWAPEVVGVRDSKDRQGGVLVFSSERWAEFVEGLRRSG
ncbi:DUF397 domain-containing protein [Saccharopolyspora sp. ID03-671]|uniref:DUF397 domain-containing protein n=1 Tax=Saccharopolyspora sp. ID03-671 TaxID=3073066 RepID=UPI00324E03CF